ncbi:hypothetical protein MKM07_002180 [Salmonella enterica]|nr:hypothetical protein [Salmonella enterica]EIX4946507.1 hypothetical protein [Salmonella enterica]
MSNMTTDITELAQSWKAAAHKAKQANDLYLEGKITLSECVIETKVYLDYSDNPNNLLALVEAMEKTRDSGKVFQQSFFRQSLMYDVVAEAYEEAKLHIAKDVEIKARLCRESNSLFDRLRAAEKRIAELESRAVTVKQFDEFQICHYGATEDYAKGYIDCQNNFFKWLNSAGIKWEAE